MYILLKNQKKNAILLIASSIVIGLQKNESNIAYIGCIYENHLILTSTIELFLLREHIMLRQTSCLNI